MSLLVTKDLVKWFGDTHAVDHVNFTVKENEVLALIGSNGAGKTTLVNLISGLFRPDGGQILVRVAEEDLAPVGPEEPGDQVDERGLAGAVRADQRQDLVLLDREVHVVDGVRVAKPLHEVLRDEQAHLGPSTSAPPLEARHEPARGADDTGGQRKDERHQHG